MLFLLFVFFFQAEDGIRDVAVTGVQTCALPISKSRSTIPASLWTSTRRPRQSERDARWPRASLWSPSSQRPILFRTTIACTIDRRESPPLTSFRSRRTCLHAANRSHSPPSSGRCERPPRSQPRFQGGRRCRIRDGTPEICPRTNPRNKPPSHIPPNSGG